MPPLVVRSGQFDGFEVGGNDDFQQFDIRRADSAWFSRPRACNASVAPMLNPHRLTVKSADALNDALSLARRKGNPLVHDAHLLRVLLDQPEGIVVPVLQKLAVQVPPLRERIDTELARYPSQSDAAPTLSRERSQSRHDPVSLD
jgi:hypothetical protein